MEIFKPQLFSSNATHLYTRLTELLLRHSLSKETNACLVFFIRLSQFIVRAPSCRMTCMARNTVWFELLSWVCRLPNSLQKKFKIIAPIVVGANTDGLAKIAFKEIWAANMVFFFEAAAV